MKIAIASKRILLIAASFIVLTGCGTTQPAVTTQPGATAQPVASPHKYTPLHYSVVDGVIHYILVDENGQKWESIFKVKPDGTTETLGPMKPYNGP